MIRFIAQFLYNFFLGVDQFINVLLLGDPDESISTRTSRALRSGKPKWWVPGFASFIDYIFMPFEKDHIYNSYEEDEKAEKELWSWIKD